MYPSQMPFFLSKTITGSAQRVDIKSRRLLTKPATPEATQEIAANTKQQQNNTTDVLE